MTLQDAVWSLSLAGMTGVALVFACVISQAGKAAWPVAARTRTDAMRR